MGLSRERMAEVIAGGGSVLHNGRLITKHENLPAADEMAQTPEEKQAATEDIDEQMRALQARRDALNAPTGVGGQKRVLPVPEEDREQAKKELGKLNSEKLLAEVEDIRKAGYTVEFADGASKTVIIEAILNAKKAE